VADLKDLFRTFKTDRNKERDGAWVEVPLNDGTIRCRIRPWLNSEHAAALVAAMAPHQKAIDDETFPEEESDRIHAQIMPGNLLLDWELSSNGTEIPFATKHAERLLSELPKFREAVARTSRKQASFLDENLEAAAEKLGKVLGGGSSTRKGSKSPRTRKE
jgi:hypothetical protein